MAKFQKAVVTALSFCSKNKFRRFTRRTSSLSWLEVMCCASRRKLFCPNFRRAACWRQQK